MSKGNRACLGPSVLPTECAASLQYRLFLAAVGNSGVCMLAGIPCIKSCCNHCRGYEQKKITENVECEIMQVIVNEAAESYK